MAFPTTTPPSLASGQFWFNNVAMGPGTPYRITKIDGLDLPQIRSQDSNRSRDHGQIQGLDLYGGRDVMLDFDIQPYGGTSLTTAMTSMAGATEVGLSTEQPLWFQLPNLPLLGVMCKARKRKFPLDKSYTIGSLVEGCSLQFHATDPRIYTASSSQSVGLSNPASGVSFPLTFPIAFGSTTPNAMTVTNSGNTEMRPILTFTGPCTNPSAENSTISGAPAITISNPSQVSYTVLSGDQLVVDLDLHSVLYYSGGVGASAGADRRNWIVYGSQWWNLPAGANTIRFSSNDSGAVAATLACEWANAYIL